MEGIEQHILICQKVLSGLLCPSIFGLEKNAPKKRLGMTAQPIQGFLQLAPEMREMVYKHALNEGTPSSPHRLVFKAERRASGFLSLGVSRSRSGLLFGEQLPLREAGGYIRMAACQQRQEDAAHPETFECAQKVVYSAEAC